MNYVSLCALLVMAAVLNTAHADSYDENLSREFLRLSAVSYCSPDQIYNWSCKHCKELDFYDVYNLTVGHTPDGI